MHHLKRPIPTGLLIAIEGIDGGGKSTLAAGLAQWCGERGIACLLSKEPTSNVWGRELRASAKAGRVSLERELELFVLDRRMHVENSIRPALAEGSLVILDRYYFSTAAYQGARGADIPLVLRTNEAFAPVPHITLLLDLPPQAGLERIRRRGDVPNHFENEENLATCRKLFVQSLQGRPHVLLDATQSPKAVFLQSLQAVQQAAALQLGCSMEDPRLAVFSE